ncbi:hypothetical protein QYF36_023056 [Acer negundo]|nr:hypothetical protein QYF36_023056 [Acer negundo]
MSHEKEGIRGCAVSSSSSSDSKSSTVSSSSSSDSKSSRGPFLNLRLLKGECSNYGSSLMDRFDGLKGASKRFVKDVGLSEK